MNNHVLYKMFLPHPDAENRQKSEGEERRLSSPIEAINSFLNNHNTIKHTGTQQNNIQHSFENVPKTYYHTFRRPKIILHTFFATPPERNRRNSQNSMKNMRKR
jgi:hypothetical protein